MLWKAMAGFEGVLATRRLGYGCCWLPMSALGLALAWQARICFHHSCESDLFQARQPYAQSSTVFSHVPRALIGQSPDGRAAPPLSSGCERLWFDDCGKRTINEYVTLSPPCALEAPRHTLHLSTIVADRYTFEGRIHRLCSPTKRRILPTARGVVVL